MKLILHIGTEKTGSSSIQTFLFDNKKSLEKAGYGYIHTPGRVDERQLAVAFMLTSKSDTFTRTHKIEGEEVRLAFRERIEKLVKDEVATMKKRGMHSCIISSEHLNSRLKELTEIQSLATYLQSQFSQISIVAYVRDQSIKFPSRYNTKIKTGGTLTFHKAFDKYLNRHGDFYDQSFQLWEKVFGNDALHLQIFDRKHFYNGDLIQDFLHLSDIELNQKDLIPLKYYANTSLSKYACEILRLVNYLLPKNNLKGTALRERMIKILHHLPGKSRTLTSAQTDLIKNKFRESNENFRKKYFPHLTSLFDE